MKTFVSQKILIISSSAGVILITFISLAPCINNGFTNWDDDVYVLNNTHIRSLAPDTVLIFFRSLYYGGYIPLTILSFALNYTFAQTDAQVYHLTNLLIHLGNCFLVFMFIFLLTKNLLVATITSLFFGIHPLHVESVAWITERKDVLYTFFFLIALIMYVYYLPRKLRKFYFLSLFFFLLSLLSKPSAISLPLVLFLLDYYYSKKLNKARLIEKIPFFLLALGFAFLAFIGQRSVGAVSGNFLTAIPKNIFISLRILLFYLYKTILPTNLSCLYPAPETMDQWLAKVFIFAPLIVGILVLLIFIYGRKTRKIIFGSLFFLITILPVLQIIPIGQSIADRYTYVPLIGLCYIFAEGWFWVTKKAMPGLKIVSVAGLILLSIWFAYLSANRCKVWKDGITLWSDVIRQFPTLAKPYNNRGIIYAQLGYHEKALRDLNMSLNLNPGQAETYNNRGLLFLTVKEYEKALADFHQAIKLNNRRAEFYNNRGYAYSLIGDMEKAIRDLNQACALKSDYPEAYLNRARCYFYLDNLELALGDVSRAIKLNPFLSDGYNLRASIYARLKRNKLAISDLTQALKINPDNADLYNSRGILYCYENRYDSALADFDQAIRLNPDAAKFYNNRGNVYASLGLWDKAINDFSRTLSIDSNYADTYYNRALAYFLKKDFARALKDLLKYKELGNQVPPEFLQSIYDSLKKRRLRY